MSDEEVKMLAKLERDMDAGLQPFVVNRGDRLAFPLDIIKRFDLECGQTVSDEMVVTIMRATIDYWRDRAGEKQWPEEI